MTIKQFSCRAAAIYALVGIGGAQAFEQDAITVTAKRINQSSQDMALSVSSLDGNGLDFRADQHIQETLSTLPGVNLHRGNGQEYLPAIRSPVLSGAGACGGLLISQDGIPVRAAGFCNINELFATHTELAERIEVIRGPGTVVHGTNALHGVIDVRTEPAIDTLLPVYRVNIEGSTEDWARGTLASRWQVNDATVAHLKATATHDGGFRDHSGFDQQKLTAHIITSGEHADFVWGSTFSNLNQETAGFITGFDAFRDDTLKRSNPNPEAYRDARDFRTWLRTTIPLNGEGQIEVTPYFRHAQMTFLQHFLPGQPTESNRHWSAGMQSSYRGNLSAGTAILAGVDIEYTQGSLLQRQDAPTQGSAFLQATIPAGKHYDYHVTALSASPFAELDMQLSDLFSSTVGVRLNTTHYDYDNRMLSGRTDENGAACGFGGCRYSRPEDRKDTFVDVSVDASLSYQPTDQQHYFVRLAQSFRAPQATELYRLQRAQLAPDLASEKLQAIEIGGKWQADPVRATVSAFAMRKSNVIFRDTDFFVVNGGRTRHIGIEGEFSIDISRTLYVTGAATLARHEYDGTQVISSMDLEGRRVDTAPDFFSNLRFGWTPNENLRAEFEWQHMGGYFLDPENAHRYGGHDLVHLRMEAKISDHARFFARVTNLTGAEYAERADFTTFSGYRYFPGLPRTATIGVSSEF